MSNDIRTWIEKMSKETAQCKCGETCNIDLIVRNGFVEVRTYCSHCDRTLMAHAPVYSVKQARVDLVELMLKLLKRDFRRYKE